MHRLKSLMDSFLNCWFWFFFCQTEQEEDIKVAASALLRGGVDPSHSFSPTDSPFHHWDSTVTTLVQSSVSPQCSTVGGDLYILTGAGGLGAAEDGDEECQTKPLWSAACCAVPQGKGGFSVGLIRETQEGVRQVSVKELEDMLGLAEMFSEGCGGGDGKSVEVGVGLHSEGLPGNTDVQTDILESREKSITKEQAANSQSGKADGADAMQETSADAATSEGSSNEQGDVTRSGAVRSDSDSSAEHETAEETDTNSTSTLVSILSTTFSIFKFPLRPVFSTITQLPGQVALIAL